MTNDNLPPLPERDTFTFLTANTPVYTADQMREYARAAWDEGRKHGQGDTLIAASPWLPIDGAPKDGTWILVMLEGYPDTVRWRNEGWHDGSGGRMVNPTHYLPIPPLPEVKP